MYIVCIVVELCSPGLYWDGDRCALCPLDTYKDVEGNNISCSACPEGLYASLPGSTECGTYSFDF